MWQHCSSLSLTNRDLLLYVYMSLATTRQTLDLGDTQVIPDSLHQDIPMALFSVVLFFTSLELLGIFGKDIIPSTLLLAE